MVGRGNTHLYLIVSGDGREGRGQMLGTNLEITIATFKWWDYVKVSFYTYTEWKEIARSRNYCSAFGLEMQRSKDKFHQLKTDE